MNASARSHDARTRARGEPGKRPYLKAKTVKPRGKVDTAKGLRQYGLS